MAKTLLQYSCLYILPFLFGMCLCGLEQKQFLTAATLGKTRYFGMGKFLLAKPLDELGLSRTTRVILKVEDTCEVDTKDLKEVSVYMKTNAARMDSVALRKLGSEIIPEEWVNFQISGNPISVLPGGTTYPNIYFDTPVNMFGYKVGSKVRFLANDISSIVKLKNVWSTADDFKMVVNDDSDNLEYFKVKVDTSVEPKISGGHILDIVLSNEEKTDPFHTQL